MRILVTGGAGYIGSHTVHYLIERGHQVGVIDNLSNSNSDIDDLPQDIKHHFCKQTLVQPIKYMVYDQYSGVGVQPYDACIHLAANTLVGESVEQPYEYLLYNSLMIWNLFDLFGDTIKRWVFASSANIYRTSSWSITENYCTTSNSPYGDGKLHGENLFKWLSNYYGSNCVILRYFNVCGNHHKSDTHLIPLALKAKKHGRKLTIYGNDYPTSDGTNVRDYVHVEDVAQANHLALTMDTGTYNVGLGVGNSVLEVAELIGVDYKFGDCREGDPSFLVSNSDKLKAQGWEPKFTSLGGILETVK